MPIFFSKQFSLDSSTPRAGGLWFNNSRHHFSTPSLKPEGGPEGDTNNVFSKEDRLRQRFNPRLT